MDHYGIGTAMLGMVNTYSSAARQTGRTTSLLESLKDGDRIVCATGRESEFMQRRCVKLGLKVTCITVDPKSPEGIFERPPSEGRTLLDHMWVELYFRHAIERAINAIDHFERQSSGYGVAHRETKERAEAISRR